MISCEGLRLALFADTYAPQMNGVARTLERLTAAVEERGGAVQVFTADDAEAQHDAQVVRYPARSFWAYRDVQLAWPRQSAVRQTLRTFDPTLIHAATEFGVGIAARRSARALQIPFVSSYHTNFAQYAQYYRLGLLSRPGWQYLRWFHNGGLRTYVPTAAIAADVEGQGFRNTKVWSRGVDATRFNPRFRSGALRREMGASENQLVVAYIGRLAAEKGIDVALDALRIVDAKRPGAVVFACVGDGPLSNVVRKRVPAGSWLPGRLHGDALSAAYASADLFLFPSTTDTFGNVQLEAMASGLAVLGADVAATREIVGDDRGFLVTPRDATAFADAIVRVVDDRAALRRAQTAALQHAQNSSWERVWDGLIADYLAVSARSAR